MMTDSEIRYIYDKVLPIMISIKHPADFFATLASITDAYCAVNGLKKLDAVSYLALMVESFAENTCAK